MNASPNPSSIPLDIGTNIAGWAQCRKIWVLRIAHGILCSHTCRRNRGKAVDPPSLFVGSNFCAADLDSAPPLCQFSQSAVSKLSREPLSPPPRLLSRSHWGGVSRMNGGCRSLFCGLFQRFFSACDGGEGLSCNSRAQGEHCHDNVFSIRLGYPSRPILHFYLPNGLHQSPRVRIRPAFAVMADAGNGWQTVLPIKNSGIDRLSRSQLEEYERSILREWESSRGHWSGM